jgi:outer membrane protein OmpA-like peptidoglycan-associated protein
VKKRLILRGVNFDFDKSNIRKQDVPVLEEAVRTLKAEGLPTVVATGYTDSVGSEAYNDKLSMRRADSVRAWLVEHGIPRNKIVAEGRGERDPVASNETEDGRAQNRRVELKIRE